MRTTWGGHTHSMQHELHTTSGKASLDDEEAILRETVHDCQGIDPREHRSPLTIARSEEGMIESKISVRHVESTCTEVSGAWHESLHGSHVRREKFDDGQLPRTPTGDPRAHTCFCGALPSRTTSTRHTCILRCESTTMWTKETPLFRLGAGTGASQGGLVMVSCHTAVFGGADRFPRERKGEALWRADRV